MRLFGYHELFPHAQGTVIVTLGLFACEIAVDRQLARRLPKLMQEACAILACVVQIRHQIGTAEHSHICRPNLTSRQARC
jgi:hypothetical protein